MKRTICLLLCVVLVSLSALSASAFTSQGTGIYRSADATGAYVISFSGTHADITRYASITTTAGVDLLYRIYAVCAHRGKIVFFCDDTNNRQVVVYVYDLDADRLDSFAIYGAKLYGNTDFCCNESGIYLENHSNTHELLAYSYEGSLLNRYLFPNDITGAFGGWHSGVYVVSGDTLYTLSGGSFQSLAGVTVETPLFPLSNQIFASAYGDIYRSSGNSLSRIFSVDADQSAASACVIGDVLYYPCGSIIYSYDLGTGEKVGYYRTGFPVKLLYADGNDVIAVGDSSYTAVDSDSFISLKRPADNSGDGDGGESSDQQSEEIVSQISSDVYRIDTVRYYILDIAPGTTVAQFKKNIHYDGYSVTLYRDGTVKTSGNVGTAMTAVFTRGNSSITFELSVTGDLTGEGNRNSRDLTVLMDYLIGTVTFNGVYLYAADVSNDGMVDVVDLALLKNWIS